MTIAKRAFFLTLSILIFFILVPVFILGIQGYTYDFSRGKLIKTGMLIAKSEPSNAEIIIEGNGVKREGRTPSAVRFLTPGDYTVRISKDGYHSWQKRFTIRGGIVTFAFGGSNKIFLLPENPSPVEVSSEYKPEPKEKISNFTYAFEPGQDSGTVNLVGYVNGSTDKAVLASNLPKKENAQIIPAPNGLVFVLANRILYQVTDRLDYLAEGVDFAQWNQDLNKLVYGNQHELNLYSPFDPGSEQRELIFRTSEVGGDYCLIPNLGYVLREYGNTIRAIELDGRNFRNVYDLFTSENKLELIDCTKDGKKVIVRENIEYKIYNLRD